MGLPMNSGFSDLMQTVFPFITVLLSMECPFLDTKTVCGVSVSGVFTGPSFLKSNMVEFISINLQCKHFFRIFDTLSV